MSSSYSPSLFSSLQTILCGPPLTKAPKVGWINDKEYHDTTPIDSHVPLHHSPILSDTVGDRSASASSCSMEDLSLLRREEEERCCQDLDDVSM